MAPATQATIAAVTATMPMAIGSRSSVADRARPKNGFHLWCQLPDGKDASRIARAALDENLILAPGNVFSAAQQAPGFMRFNVTQMQAPRVLEGLKRVLAGG